MADLTTSNVKSQVTEAFVEGIRMPFDGWTSAFNMRNDNVPSLRIGAVDVAGEVATWDGSSDLTTDAPNATDPLTLTVSQFGTQIRVSKLDAADMPGLVGDCARKLGVAVAATYGAKAVTLLDNADSDTVPMDSLSLVNDAHTMSTGGTRDNKGTSALDITALMAAITAFRNWQSYRALPYDLVPGGFYLVVPPGLEEAAMQAVGSQFTSAALQVNVAGSFDIDVIVWSQLSDGNNWFLISKIDSPLHFWERIAPAPRVVIDQDNEAIKVNVDFAIAYDAGPGPDGIYGGIVA